MMWKFNEKVVDRMVKKALRLFSKSKNVTKDEIVGLKAIARCTIIIMNDQLRVTWGSANMIDATFGHGNHKSIRERYNLRKNHGHRKVKPKWSNRNQFFLMGFSTKICQYIPATDVYDTVAHELAHLLQFFLEGDSFHDKTWRRYHTAMNGNGEAYIPYAVPITVLKSKKLIKKK